jgi:nicotinate phosphoribosyltransferase
MAYGYWKLGLHNREAVFHLIFRKHPFRGNYALAAGLGNVIDFLNNFHFTDTDIAYLKELKAPDGSVLFPEAFLTYLRHLTFTCDVDAIPEGTVVFPHEPLLRIKGPLLQGQLIESTLLNLINFQSLIATKASRVYLAAQGDSVLEFGLRRAQGPDGALSASRAAYIGGCEATSNVLAGKLYDIPVRGTHAHSWVTAFPDELAAFQGYADVMPNNCVLLVDTYDTVLGVKHAILVGKELRKQNAELRGIRLDSGDLGELSRKARVLLDEAGFPETKIIASNSLDEYVIAKLKQEGAPIDIWGVGTNLVTAYDHPALDGVYKLSALRDEKGEWQYKLKLSEQVVKVSNPGIYQIRRYFDEHGSVVDMMYDIELGISEESEIISFDAPHSSVAIKEKVSSEDLLVPIFSQGKLVYEQPTIHQMREQAIAAVANFTKKHKDTLYFVGLEKTIHEFKKQLINEVRQNSHERK